MINRFENRIEDALNYLKEQHKIGNHGLNKFKKQNEKLIELVKSDNTLFRTLGFERN